MGSVELDVRMHKHLTPEEAVKVGEDLQEATLTHFRNRYDVLANADYKAVVQAMIKGAVPGGPKGSIDPKDVEFANNALAAAQWLVFWGRHGYRFKCSEPAKG